MGQDSSPERPDIRGPFLVGRARAWLLPLCAPWRVTFAVLLMLAIGLTALTVYGARMLTSSSWHHIVWFAWLSPAIMWVLTAQAVRSALLPLRRGRMGRSLEVVIYYSGLAIRSDDGERAYPWASVRAHTSLGLTVVRHPATGSTDVVPASVIDAREIAGLRLAFAGQTKPAKVGLEINRVLGLPALLARATLSLAILLAVIEVSIRIPGVAAIAYLWAAFVGWVSGMISWKLERPLWQSSWEMRGYIALAVIEFAWIAWNIVTVQPMPLERIALLKNCAVDGGACFVIGLISRQLVRRR